LRIFKGPEDGVLIRIHAIRLVREITAANWLRHHAIETERKILAISPISDNSADCLTEFVNKEHVFQCRAAAFIDGDRLFFIQNLARSSAYPKYEEVFGVPVMSFDISKQSGKPSVEKHIPYNSDAIVRFAYPASWKCRAAAEKRPGEKGDVDLFSIGSDGNVSGRMRIKTVEKSFSKDNEARILETIAEYRDHNVIAGGILETVEAAIATSRFDSALVRAYRTQIRNDEIGQEIWIAVIEDPKYHIIISMLTPFREQAFFLWAVNRRAYGIILESLS